MRKTLQIILLFTILTAFLSLAYAQENRYAPFKTQLEWCFDRCQYEPTISPYYNEYKKQAKSSADYHELYKKAIIACQQDWCIKQGHGGVQEEQTPVEDNKNFVLAVVEQCRNSKEFSPCVAGAVCRLDSPECYINCAVQAKCAGCKVDHSCGTNTKLGYPVSCNYNNVQTCFSSDRVESKQIQQPSTTPVHPSPSKSPEEQACLARPNMQFVSSKCVCKTGFYQDLKLQGCITSQELETLCRQVNGASFANNKCVCPKNTPYASGFTNRCETKLDFANQVCSARNPGFVYDEAQKTCVKADQCQGRTNMQYDKTLGKCICKTGFLQDLKLQGCITSQELETLCRQVDGASFANNKCLCPKNTPYASGFTNKCETKLDFANQVCNSRMSGSLYDEKQKDCYCPLPTQKAADGKSCISTKGAKSCDNDDSKCPNNQRCENGICVDVNCPCGEIKNHQCQQHQCCNNDPCAKEEKCDLKTHSCVRIDCPRGIIVNHECEVSCVNNEDAMCAYNEKCKDDKCVVIPCECGVIVDHACKPAECCETKPCLDKDKECNLADGKCVDVGSVCRTIRAGSGNINLVFIPSYTKKDAMKFASDAQRVYSSLFSLEPFKSNPNLVNVYRVDLFDKDLGCSYWRAPKDPVNQKEWRGLSCNPTKMVTVASKCPGGYIFALVNSMQFGGSAGGVGSLYGYMSSESTPLASVHEMGHMFGLEDEYSKGPTGLQAWAAMAPNCDINPSCDKWKGVPATSCISGCAYDNWFRPSQSDLMRDFVPDFGPVSQRHLLQFLEGEK